MKNLLIVVGGISISTALFIILLPLVAAILLIKYVFKKIDKQTN